MENAKSNIRKTKRRSKMNLLRKALIPLGGVAITSLLLTLLAPPAAHAIVATLVQVANTTANPVPTIDASKTAANIVNLTCNAGSGFCYQIPTTGVTAATPYTVPIGMNLVITRIDATNNHTGSTIIALFNSTSVIEDAEFIVPSMSTFVDDLGSGVVESASAMVTATSSEPIGQFLYLRGYLTPE
jgi:hypothetical protein